MTLRVLIFSMVVYWCQLFIVKGRTDSSFTRATGMSQAHAQRISVTGDALVVDLVDGRTLTVPPAWYPRLLHGSPAERARWRLIGNGAGVHWPDLDEDISVEGLLTGRRAAETTASLRRWLDARKAD